MKALLLLSLTIILLISCSSNTKKEIEVEKKQISKVEGREEMHDRMRAMINTSKKLDESQKEDFLTLHNEVLGKVATIDTEMKKLKLVLFNNLTQKKYDTKKVNQLKQQLKKLNNDKFDTMINAMSDARSILGISFKDMYPRADFRDNFHGKY
ncbi:hypothetical protein N9N67_10180 [Bacteriovoracaceae bacterium]|nr:hypothetical protein [Bacteriovoracaceae bacterium]